MGRLCVLLGIAACAAPSLAHADFPRAGIPEIENGRSAPFVGSWQVGYPETPDTIVAEIITPCEMAVVIASIDDNHVSYASPKAAEPTVFELRSFAGRTSMIPEGATSSIAVWDTPDSFYLYSLSISGGADWDNPLYLKRCP